MSVIIANKRDCVDSAYHTLVKHINSPYPIVMVSSDDKFVFNDELLTLDKYVLVSYNEFGWNFSWDRGTPIFGVNAHQFEQFQSDEWQRFDEWVANNPPLITFQRELLEADRSSILQPIDYTANFTPIPIVTREAFYHRPITACYYFGRSHEDRLRLHASIWEGATKYGYSVCDNIYQIQGFLENERGKKYVSMHMPHYHRIPIENVLEINGLSKIGVAPFGAGIKTFRAAEVSANAVMLMWEDDLAWQEKWVHGHNCIKCKPGEEVQTIEEWANSPNLYSIYLSGVETWNEYHVKNYLPRIENLINKL